MSRTHCNRAPFPSLLDAARQAVAEVLEAFVLNESAKALLAVDATCGNGNDTLFLAEQLCTLGAAAEKPWRVLGLDIQEQALHNTDMLLRFCPGRDRVKLILQGHEHIAALINAQGLAEREAGRPVPATVCVMYNLGFLPRSDKTVVTKAESTMLSLTGAAWHLAPGGLLVVHAYGGHEGGSEEYAVVDAWCAALPYADWLVMRYALANKPHNPEALFLVQRRMSHERADGNDRVRA